jgi:CheY-like chemotaxis protein
VESEPGKGSTFAFTVKVERDSHKPSGMVQAGVHWGNVRVLCVDDDLYIRDYFKEISAQFGFACDTAAGGEEAIAGIEKNGPYDIYFVDWKMQGMNGIETSRKIKELTGKNSKNLRQSVVTMISAAEWNSIEDEARIAGVDKFLSKPLFPSAIADCINQCLGVANVVAAEESAPAPADNFAGRRILLAEDVEVNREIVLALLEPTGVTIDCAENGVEAVKMFAASVNAQTYDMIFMDVQMPEMDGYEATRRIREVEEENQNKRIPIIAMTANVFREDVEKCLAAGMNDHIGKPLDFEEVLVKLRTHLQSPPLLTPNS